MVSYYNSPLSYAQKHSAPNLSYPTAPHHQAWFPTQYPPHPAAAAAAANQQFFTGMDAHHHSQSMYYNPAMFHQSPEFYTRENFQNLTHSQALSMPPVPSTNNPHLSSNGSSPLDETSSSAEILTEGIPSPPIASISGSEISSPGIPNASSSPRVQNGTVHQQQQHQQQHQHQQQQQQQQNGLNDDRPTPSNSPYYEWMKKPNYTQQPQPGKTRTKDKYRVVYTDYQRLELEKEYHTSRYITIRRKTELAQSLQLSERQVKIWFQNRRAKERKQTKKRDDPITNSTSTSGITILTSGGGQGLSPNDEFINFMDTKPKLEHLQHQHPVFHHQMAAMSSMAAAAGLHPHHLHHGHHLAAAAAAVGASPPTSHHHMTSQPSYLGNTIESIS